MQRASVVGMSGIRLTALTALLVVFGLGLLYAYRSQTPALQTVPISQAVQEIQAGKVKSVTETANKATLELVDNTREQTNIPDNTKTDPLADAVAAYNKQNPTHPVTLKYEEQSATWSVIGSVLLSLLPLVLIALFILMVVAVAARGGARAPDRTAQLERLADLRDRGVLTEDEFQREKQRILK